jgi:uncharacterized protein HemX
MNIKNLLCVVSAIALAASVAQAQTLPELAKAEKQRRAKMQKAGGPAKVYTEGERSGSSSDAVSVASAPAGASGSAPVPGGKKEKTPEEIAAEQQKEWTDKVSQAQTQIKDLEAGITTKERNLASLINITPARQDLANSIETDKKTLADLKKSLVDLEDQRRRAGMPRPR